jgi:mannitol-specific phosphotransferase system IIBC component
MDVLTGIFSAFGLSASAGLNAYIPLLVVALLGKFTNLIKLDSPWDTLTNWWVIGLIGVLCLIEIFVDIVPAVNHINDAIQTFVRPVAGAIIFAASAKVLTDIHPVLSLACGLLVAGSVHAVKSAAVRPAVMRLPRLQGMFR